MFSARSKIIKSGNERPDEFETSISQAVLELESNSDLEANLRELYITAAKEVDVGGGKKQLLYLCLSLNCVNFRRSKYDLYGNWRRNSVESILFLLLREEFCLNPPESQRFLLSRSAQEVVL